MIDWREPPLRPPLRAKEPLSGKASATTSPESTVPMVPCNTTVAVPEHGKNRVVMEGRGITREGIPVGDAS